MTAPVVPSPASTEEVAIAWRSGVLPSFEHAVHRTTTCGHLLEGTAVTVLDGSPATIVHAVEIDPTWRTRSVEVSIRSAAGTWRLEAEVDERARWRVDGRRAPELDGCLDVDLGWTPATNLMPLRRLDPVVGTSATIEAAWLSFPGLTLQRTAQTYTRLDDRRWTYTSGTFEATLHTDGAGHVVTYGDDDPIWETLATA